MSTDEVQAQSPDASELSGASAVSAPQLLGYARFVVNETPYCIWGWLLDAENERNLANIDPKYFLHVAKSNAAHLNGERSQFAAAALRVAYGHGLEAMFALLCAAFQAPGCVAGWLTKYRNVELDALVSKIQRGEVFRSRFALAAPGWEGLARVMFAHVKERDRAERMIEQFTRAWARLAGDFLEHRTV